MNKQEQIGEMVKTVVDREKNYVIGETECKKCNLNKCDLHCNIHSEISYDCETLYNAGYRKVICDRDNFTDLLNEETKELSLIEKTRKKTAKEILSGLLDLCNSVQDINQKTDFYYSIELLIAEIKIKYGIEVEE